MDSHKDAASVRVFPPLVPLATILIAIAINYLWPIGFPFEMPEALRYWLGGFIIVGALVGLGGWAVLVMRLDGQSENPYKPTLAILERGPFRVTRNPMYLQMVLICIGVGILLLNGWLVLLAPVCAWILWRLAIEPEEAYLEQKFGDEYRDYKNRVRRWI